MKKYIFAMSMALLAISANAQTEGSADSASDQANYNPWIGKSPTELNNIAQHWHKEGKNLLLKECTVFTKDFAVPLADSYFTAYNDHETNAATAAQADAIINNFYEQRESVDPYNPFSLALLQSMDDEFKDHLFTNSVSDIKESVKNLVSVCPAILKEIYTNYSQAQETQDSN